MSENEDPGKLFLREAKVSFLDCWPLLFLFVGIGLVLASLSNTHGLLQVAVALMGLAFTIAGSASYTNVFENAKDLASAQCLAIANKYNVPVQGWVANYLLHFPDSKAVFEAFLIWFKDQQHAPILFEGVEGRSGEDYRRIIFELYFGPEVRTFEDKVPSWLPTLETSLSS